ncbi:MAG: helix-turn-helix domain-containing protein [Lentisphaeraceae bacterium]|nr:helix-turn-helix domain-containing protein [Lentisphaeraceae bacterium]
MGVKVTPELKEGIRKAILDLGSQDELAKAVSVSKSAINRYLNVDTEIRASNYKSLMQVVSKYIDQNDNEQKCPGSKLTPDAEFMIDLYSKLDSDQKKEALTFLSSLAYKK